MACDTCASVFRDLHIVTLLDSSVKPHDVVFRYVRVFD